MAKAKKTSVVKSTVEIMRKKASARARQIKKAKANLKKAVAARNIKLGVQRAKETVVPLSKESVPKTYSAKELQHFKEIIIEKRRETIEELDNLKESMMDVTTGEYVSENSSYSLHMEQGTDAMEREKTFLFASRGSKYVNQLDDALARIEAGTYGVCKVCHLLVPKERLEAVPTAQTCAEFKNTNMPCERGREALAKRGRANR